MTNDETIMIPTFKTSAELEQLKKQHFQAFNVYSVGSIIPLTEAYEVAEQERVRNMVQRDQLKAQLEDYRKRFDVEASQEKCLDCGKYYSPSLIESSSCVFCIAKSKDHQLTIAREAFDAIIALQPIEEEYRRTGYRPDVMTQAEVAQEALAEMNNEKGTK